MSKPARKWDDLRARFLTSLVLIVVGGLAIWAGGLVLLALVSLVAAAMVWELVRMLAPDQRPALIVLPILAAGAVWMVSSDLPYWAMICIPAILGFVFLARGKGTFLVYSAVIMTGAGSLYVVRQEGGLMLVLLVILVVVVTDIGGYFVGRMVGGPKFWPQVSPKKTWSGTVAGWVGAALVGLIWSAGSVNFGLIAACVALSFASQMGDIGESAIKRMAGIKDSSDLLPGHGGFLDRFDGMIAAFGALAVIALFTDVFPGPF